MPDGRTDKNVSGDGLGASHQPMRANALSGRANLRSTGSKPAVAGVIGFEGHTWPVVKFGVKAPRSKPSATVPLRPSSNIHFSKQKWMLELG